MRLKEDSSSYKAIGLKAKLLPVPEQVVTHAKKNTKRWCKGKVGHEHEWGITKMRRFHAELSFFGDALWQDWACENCGKQDYDVVRKV